MIHVDFLIDGLDQTVVDQPTFLFAHGAGATMDAPFMANVAKGLASRGIRVVRFEFAYMAARRSGGPKRPPPKIEILLDEYRDAVTALACGGPLIIGGKSMGGRVASLIADDLCSSGHIQGLLCLGYPFHPKGKPEKLRTSHLSALQTPTLICQGTRDALGTREEVKDYDLSAQVKLVWSEDGDHDLKPRKRVTGLDHAEQLDLVCERAAEWVMALTRSS